MKLDKSPKIIVLGFIGTAIGFAGTAAIATGLFSAQTANAQTNLHSVPEISWDTRLNSFESQKQHEGQIFTFQCPAAPKNQFYAPVWGTDIYTFNSGLCQAAVHGGMITQDGGLINVEIVAGESVYQGSERFGVTSKNYEGEVDSFRFIGNPITLDSNDPHNEDAQNSSRRRPNSIERAVGNGVRRGIERTISDSIRDIFR